MLRQRFSTRTTTKRAFVFNLNLKESSGGDEEKVEIEQADEENSSDKELDNSISGDKDIVVYDNEDGNKDKEDDRETVTVTPNSPFNNSDILKEILKHPPLGTSTPRIAITDIRTKQMITQPKSLFRPTVTLPKQLSKCSPIRKFAVKKSSSPLKKAKTVTVPKSPRLAPRSTAKKVSEIRTLNDNISTKGDNDEISANSSKSLDDKTSDSSVGKVKHVLLSKSSIEQVSINSQSSAQLETAEKSQNSQQNSPTKSPKPQLSAIDIQSDLLSQKLCDKDVAPIPVNKTGQSYYNNNSKNIKKSQPKSKVPREVKLLMEQNLKISNLKSTYDHNTGEVTFEQNIRLHKPVTYNINKILSQIDKPVLVKKKKTRIKKDPGGIYDFNEDDNDVPNQKVKSKKQTETKNKSKNKIKHKKQNVKSSQKVTNSEQDSGNHQSYDDNQSPSPLFIKRKQQASEDDNNGIFIQKKQKVASIESDESDSGYCKSQLAGGKVRSKKALYTKHHDQYEHELSTTSSSSSSSKTKHLVHSMKYLVKKADQKVKSKKASKR